MGLTNGAATSDRTTSGDVAATATTLSVAFWYKPTTLTAFRTLWSKYGPVSGGKVFYTPGNDTAQVRFDVRFSTTFSGYRTNNAGITTGKWWFVAATFEDGQNPHTHIYRGSLVDDLTECTYDVTDQGSGSLLSDAGGNVHWFNDQGNANAQQCVGAIGLLFNTVLSLADLKQVMRETRHLTGALIHHELGIPDAGTQADLTGNGNTGTVTGATATTDHVPLPVRWQGGLYREVAP
jgi:hypothetical protein